MKLTIKDCLILDFEGSRNEGSFKNFTTDEYIGYVTAMTIRNHAGKICMSVEETLKIARELVSAKVL